MSRHVGIGAVALVSLLAFGSSAALADTGGDPAGDAPVDAQRAAAVLDIEQVDTQSDGTTSVTVSVSGLPEDVSLSPDDLEVVENGVVVEGVSAGDPEVIGEEVVPAVVIAMDTSGSLEGEGIVAARDAARALALDITGAGGLVSVVSFDGRVNVLAELTDDGDVATAAIDRLEARGATRLYDGVARSVRIAATHDGPADVIVFSDGEDNGSSTGLDQVRALAENSEVPVTTVRLLADGVTQSAVDALAAVSGGEVIRINDMSELLGAFQVISNDLRNRVTLSWVAEPALERSPFINLVVTYTGGQVRVSDGVQETNPRQIAIPPPTEVVVPGPLFPALATSTGLTVGLVAVGFGTLLLGLVLFGVVSERRRSSRLDRRLSIYEEGAGGGASTPRESRSITDRAVDLVDVIPRPGTIDARIAARIEQADWPMRVGEFLLMMVSVGLLFFVAVFLAVGAPWYLALVASSIGAAVPAVVLSVAAQRRQAAFADQLPDVLQVIGGALRAGHAFSTAVEGAVGEIDAPASDELRRASVEARLGRPMDKALLGVAERMGSVDLTWVVSALAVQREVGGNMAEVLSNVAGTLRARASVRRQVQALSAEGRLSATVISVIPFAMFVLLTFISPGYVSLLFTTPMGRVMLLIGFVLLLVGVLVLRQLVKPKF